MWEKVPSCRINHACSFCKYTSSHSKILSPIDCQIYRLIEMLVTANSWRFRGSRSLCLKPVGAYSSQSLNGDSQGYFFWCNMCCRHSVKWHLLTFLNEAATTVLQFIVDMKNYS